MADYPLQHRGGQGVYTIQMTDRKGKLAAMKTVGPQHELFIITEGATVIRVKTDEISQTGRATQGVKMMSVADGDRVTAVARMTSAKKKPAGPLRWPRARRRSTSVRSMPRARRTTWTSARAIRALRICSRSSAARG